MKQLFISLFCAIAWISGSGSNWISINGSQPSPAAIRVVSSTIEKSTVHVTLDGYSLSGVQTPRGEAFRVNIDNATPMLVAGSPDLPKLTFSLVIPDRAGMEVHVVSSVFKDYDNILVAPSKGIMMRNTDPRLVPFQFGKTYTENRFFPGDLTGSRDPYIIRDLRGQTLIVYPFQYNPVTKTLRVYYDMTVELVKVNDNGYNPLVRKVSGHSVNPEFHSVYERHFMNYGALSYTPLNDYGKTLVICYNGFMNAMLPYVNWKNSIGYPTEMIDVATAGATPDAIKTFIANYYNTNGLTFVLLVGDNAQIPTIQTGNIGGPSDNAYGYIVGNDHYQDVFVGRFSAETVAQVQTQVQRSVDYEKSPQFITDDWFSTVLGIGSDQGPGDDNEYDYQHIRNQQTQLLAYTYTANPELFDGSQGGNDASGNPTPAMVSTEVNNGTGLILYTGHGSSSSWGTTGFSSTNVNALANPGKLPFVWSVACVNGEFMNGTCFAESWMRASQGGQPTGAVAFLGSTINQSWNSPMEGQDEMTAILTESYSTNIKRTFAGLSINGCMKMIDSYGVDGQNMADTWTVFGDPSLQVRTHAPLGITATHDATLSVGGTSLTISCNVNGARATASLNNTMLSTGLVTNNTITLNFPALPAPNDSLHLVITGYNRVPYITDIPIITPNGPYVLCSNNHVNDTTGNNNDMVDYGEDILLTLYLKNVGVAASGSLNVKLRSNDPYIILNDTTEPYGSIPPNQVRSVVNAYRFLATNAIPDGHSIPLTVVTSDGTNTWVSNCSITAHSPVLKYSNIIVNDSAANQNAALDPGETASLKIFIGNTGSSAAENVTGHLVCFNPYVTITSESQNYGELAAGQSKWRYFVVHVSDLAPSGQTATFLLQIAADRDISSSGNFDLVIGKVPLLIVDLDGNTNSGPVMKTAAESLGVYTNYTAANVPDSLSKYSSVFVCLGAYSSNHVLTTDEGQKLASYLDGGGHLYMEGGDTWKFDPATAVHPMFDITGLDDGSGDLGTINGISGTFTQGLSYPYAGDNAYIDHLSPIAPAFSIFANQSPAYFNAVAHDGGTFRTIGSSFEFGGLIEGTGLSTKSHLMEEYLNFFGIQMPALMANFSGYPTLIGPGGHVSFSDYTSGGASSWNWSFPGGTPAASTDQNPVVTYNTEGSYDVQLIVHNATGADTILKTGYITVDHSIPVGTGSSSVNIGCSIWPNPGNGLFRLTIASAKNELFMLTVYNTLGKTVFNKELASKTETLDLSGLPEGTYLLKITGSSSEITKKLVIRK